MSRQLYITSHVKGKNAKVSLYPDRLEWEVKERTWYTMWIGSRLTSEMIPTRAITSVISKKSSAFNTVVQVVTSGNTIDFRVSHNEAKELKRLILENMQNI